MRKEFRDFDGGLRFQLGAQIRDREACREADRSALEENMMEDSERQVMVAQTMDPKWFVQWGWF